MAGVITEIITKIVTGYSEFISILPPLAQKFLNLFLLVVLVFFYAIFVWKFHKYVSTKNLLGLNLSKYNRSDHPVTSKFFALVLYFIEYIIILPFVVFFWFSIFTVFVILMSEGKDLQSLLLISATIVASIRVTAYYNENLSNDIAKLLPLTFLAISLTTSGFFNFERILTTLTQIPSYMGDLFIYFLFIIFLEVILRFFDFIFSLFELDDVPRIKEN